MTFHFPANIRLSNPPLIEAWLEIQWQLEATDPNTPQIMRDPGFKFALGWFFSKVRERFPHKIELPAAEAPEDLLPHVVRYQFRPDEEQWPVIQIGPGIATVNFVGDYQWEDFDNLASYLRENLIEAYDSAQSDIVAKSITLRYRNAEPFSDENENVLLFLAENLNTNIQLPPQIPGEAAEGNLVDSLNLELEFKLQRPIGRGRIRLSTGLHLPTGTKQFLWEIGIMSDENCPSINDSDAFSSWLDAAHDLNHEWFFSFVEGSLFDKYQ